MNKHYLSQDDRHAGNIARWKDYQKQQLVCQECGNTFSVPPSVIKKGKGKYCSQVCANKAKGRAMSVERHFKQNGYIYIKTWEHPKRSKQNLVAEHRLVVEKYLNRFLTDDEVVHHIDSDKHHNELYNLFLCRNEDEHRVVEHLGVQFVRMFNVARYQHWEAFKNFDVTKDRQDQLVELLGGFLAVCEAIYWWLECERVGEDYHGYGLESFDSMEQLLLVNVMYTKYNKVWNDKTEEWELCQI